MRGVFSDGKGCRFTLAQEDGVFRLLPVTEGEAREIPLATIRRVERCPSEGKTGLYVTLEEDTLLLTTEGDVPVEELDGLFPGKKVEDAEREGKEKLKSMCGCLIAAGLFALIPFILGFGADWLRTLYWIVLCVCLLLMQARSGGKLAAGIGFVVGISSLYENMPAVCLPDYRQLVMPVLGITVLLTLLMRLVMWKQYSMKRLLGLTLLAALLFAPAIALMLNTLHLRTDRAYVSTADWKRERIVPLIDIYRARVGDEDYYMNESFADKRRYCDLAVLRTGWLGIDYLEPEDEDIQKSSPRS